MGPENMDRRPVGSPEYDPDTSIFENLQETDAAIPEPQSTYEELVAKSQLAEQKRKAREAAEKKARPGIIAAIKRRLLEGKKDKVA